MGQIIKSSGEAEEFSADKLIKSIINAGGSQSAAETIEKEVETILHNQDTTDQIHELVLEKLKQLEKPVAVNYNMRRAIAELGPSGFPFEKFIAEIFTRIGYKTETNVMLKGKCVDHEIDVMITDPETNKSEICEVKFHNKTSIKTSVKVPLYVKARFDDVKYGQGGADNNVEKVWIITNTKFSKSAITYGECNDLNLLAWNYPYDRSLSQIIDELRVHPITALTTLTDVEKVKLINKGLVLCSQVIQAEENMNLFKDILAQDKNNQLDEALEEITAVCRI